MRVKYARDEIVRAFFDEDGFVNPSVHGYRLEREDGKSAIIGITVQIHGQGGPVPVWQGVFATQELFHAR